MFLYVFEFFFHHFGSPGVVFERFENFSLFKILCIASLSKGPKLYKTQNFQIAQKPSKITPNGSKTCFNMFLSVFESFGVILEPFRHFLKFFDIFTV